MCLLGRCFHTIIKNALFPSPTDVRSHNMNKSRLHPNKSDHQDRLTKKNLKELKVTSYTNKVHLPFWWLNQTNLILGNLVFSKMHVSKNKTCWNDSGWFVGIVVTWPCSGQSRGYYVSNSNFESWSKSWAWIVTLSIFNFCKIETLTYWSTSKLLIYEIHINV